MPYSGKIPKAAAKNGEDENAMMERLLIEHQTPYKIATALGIYPNAVRAWLKRNGYVSTANGWEKQTQPELTAQRPRL